MEIVALKSFPYSGRRVNVGERFTVDRKHGLALVHLRLAMVAEVVEVPKAPKAPKVPKAKKPAKEGTYKRRDMKAEK
jgi:hypothetical protein